MVLRMIANSDPGREHADRAGASRSFLVDSSHEPTTRHTRPRSIVRADDSHLTPEFASRLVSLRADPVVQDKIDSLAEKCNEGRLTPDERDEYEMYVNFIHFMGIFQAKARRFLADTRPS